MTRSPKPPPKPSIRTKGAEAICYRAAMVVLTMDVLFAQRPPGQELPVHVRNAFVQSTLTDLRSLIGFLLMDADDVRPKRDGSGYQGIMSLPNDVKPSWYMPTGGTWEPQGKRRRRALYPFFEPVSTHLAHVVIRTRAHPGAWPVIEAALVVGQDLGQFVDQLRVVAPNEAKRFIDAAHPLPDTLAALASRNYAQPYPVGRAEGSVQRARRLLRTQLGWPK
jgi:hypothetical protein